MSAETIGIEELIDLDSFDLSSFVHIVRGVLPALSLKTSFATMSEMFLPLSDALEISSSIDSINEELSGFLSKFPTKDYMDNTFFSKEELNDKKSSFVAFSEMKSLTGQYVTESKMKSVEDEAKKEANRLADEMTDFVAAAYVGINQSAYQAVEPAGEGEGKSKKKD